MVGRIIIAGGYSHDQIEAGKHKQPLAAIADRAPEALEGEWDSFPIKSVIKVNRRRRGERVEMDVFWSWYAVYVTAALVPILFSPIDAWSADLCKAVAVRDVAAVEAPDSVLARGSYDDSVTQYRVNKQTGMTTFCSHGGYCYPTHVRVNGQKVEALRLINCKIGERNYEDKDEVFYSVDIVRSKNSSAELRLDDLDNKFLEMGLCSACAGNVAMFYVKKPASPCARLAKQALEGNPVATDKLRDFPDYCKWGW